jgi:hypothetical protein
MRLTTKRSLRILDFDMECRFPAIYGGDFLTRQPTAIAWKFIGEPGAPRVAWIGESGDNNLVEAEEREMIELFRVAYDAADMVTGHFIRGFDLPVINASLIRLGGRLLDDKLTSDTKLDLAKASGISKSQENLGAMFELDEPKVQMNTTKWTRANYLTREGMQLTRERVIGDVMQHIALRARMVELGLLAPPRVWSAQSSGIGNYHA